jgi:hypothetical protein
MITRALLIATVATFGFVSYASAQDAGEGTATYIGPKRTKTVKLSKAHHEKMLKMGHVATGSVMVYHTGGKTYVLENKPGKAAGKTMIQEEFEGLMPDSAEY